MKKTWTIITIALFALGACQKNPSNEKRVEELSVTSNADIIRNPDSADGSQDTANVAKMTFEEITFDFGEAKQGDIVTHVYKFKNTGKVPLLISDARSTCGCTIPEWSKEPIEPGQSSEINVKFNTAGKSEKQEKPITITANTYPSETKVYLKGFVKEQVSQ